MRKEFKFERRLRHSGITSQIQDIKKEIAVLKKRQEHIEDSLFSADDDKSLKEARDDLKNKKTVSLSEIKRKLDL